VTKKRILSIVLVVLLVTGVIAVSIILRPIPKVHIKRLKNGDYQLLVGRKPWVVKGVCYNPTPIGEGPTYNFWEDPHQPWKIDGKLMYDMGVNTVRFYRPGKDPLQTKIVIRELYRRYGIRTILGHWLGFWEYPFPNYGDPEFRERVKRDVLKMVKDYKDEEGILLWVLGNENNFSFGPQRLNPWSTPEIEKINDPYERQIAKAKIFYSYVNDIARETKRIDPNHPIALGNGELDSIEIAKEVTDAIDLLGAVSYRGKTFGNFWRELERKFDKPVVFIEFGCDSFNAESGLEDQEIQALFLKSQWEEIEENMAGGQGRGNSLGGCVFEWSDEWWKHNEGLPSSWYVQNKEGKWSSGAYYFDIAAPHNMNMNEEWWGIVSLSLEKENGINKRIPKKAYYMLKELWKK
jgi:hypothetical protein